MPKNHINMIPYREIRIGNWIIANGFYRQVFGVVAGKEVAGIWLTRNGNETIGSHMIKPIPLTPELLAKCEFNKGNIKLMPNFDLLRLPLDSNRQFRYDSANGLSIETIGTVWIWNFPHIKHLHQLQNLYCDLTCAELTANL